MRILYTLVLFFCASFLLNAQIINEIHYDNAGGDVNEMVEVFIPNPQPGDLSMYSIELINQSGTVYDTKTLDAFTGLADATGTYYYYDYPSNGIQNGGNDGLALCGPSGLIEALSYEGTTTATSGCSMGVTTTDIGVAESNSTPIGTSIQRNSMGAWEAGLIATPGAANANALPIDLMSFNASLVSEKVNLSWSTATETNNDYFIVEHSRNGVHFSPIAEIAGAGNSFVTTDYSFKHESPAKGMNYYRLQQVDYDRSFSYSEVRSVDIDATSELNIWPTLVQDRAVIDLGDQNTSGTIRVISSAGQVVQEYVLNNQDGNFELALDHLTNGTYIVALQTDAEVISRRIMVQK